MKKVDVILCSILLMFCLVGQVMAGTYTFNPNDTDIQDLDHYYYYEWGINWSVPSGEKIVSAQLSIDDIYNWTREDDILYIHLLDTLLPNGTEFVSDLWRFYDNQQSGDNFGSNGILLTTYSDFTDLVPEDYSYDFTGQQIMTLEQYTSDGQFFLGFDPDCHYYNDGFQLTIETSPVPEPTTMLLLGSGLVGLAGFRRKFRKN